MVPPLLNDFISLQKDVALVSILGPQEAFRVAQIDAASDFNYTPLHRGGAALPRASRCRSRGSSTTMQARGAATARAQAVTA